MRIQPNVFFPLDDIFVHVDPISLCALFFPRARVMIFFPSTILAVARSKKPKFRKIESGWTSSFVTSFLFHRNNFVTIEPVYLRNCSHTTTMSEVTNALPVVGDPCRLDSALLLSMEEDRRSPPSPQPSVLSMDSTLSSRSPIPVSPLSALFHFDDDSAGMSSCSLEDDGNADKHERIQLPSGLLPQEVSYANGTIGNDHDHDHAPQDIDLGMPWMCVYDLDNVCIDVNDESPVDHVQVQIKPRPQPHRKDIDMSIEAQTAPAIPTGFLPEHLHDVFSTGLLPHLTEWFKSSDLAKTNEPVWNGHLPLAPEQSLSGQPSSPYRRRRGRSEIGKGLYQPQPPLQLSGPSPLQQHVHVTIFSPDSFDLDIDVEAVYSLVCVFKVFVYFYIDIVRTRCSLVVLRTSSTIVVFLSAFGVWVRVHSVTNGNDA
jgi:hypothetical protein